MTFDAWFEVLKWLAVPGVTGLCWWIYLIDARRREVTHDLYSRLDVEREAREEADRRMRELVHAAQLDAATRYATAETVEKAVGRVVAELHRLTERFDRFLEIEARKPKGGPGQ